MRCIYCLCLMVLLAATSGKAQFIRNELLGKRTPVNSPGYWRADVDTGKLYLRMNPAGLIDMYDMNINIGSEYRINHNWSATMDAGYIYFSQYAGRVKHASGILLRPGIRKYAGKRKDFFLELQLHYKEVSYRVEDWLEKSLVNDVATYEEYKTFRYHKQVFGAHFTIGAREYLSRNHRWFFEVYAGVGLHYKKEGMRNETNSRYDPPNLLLIANGSSETVKRFSPAVPGGIRLVFRLSRK